MNVNVIVVTFLRYVYSHLDTNLNSPLLKLLSVHIIGTRFYEQNKNLISSTKTLKESISIAKRHTFPLQDIVIPSVDW